MPPAPIEWSDGRLRLALAANAGAASERDGLLREVRAAAQELAATRPTAPNLSWALQRCLSAAESAHDASFARITAIITERGVARTPNVESLTALFEGVEASA